eukprot:TRINITY_DN7144_c0_g1_i1.p1 TRINITY_DN7144_c0_g1~~TRINITY_DN7144_c0_g1_i1.p1  ORF type:complete len:535 (+),score=87.58 TRINITY_DN7144_c0_g1_i1:52-1656(+)
MVGSLFDNCLRFIVKNPTAIQKLNTLPVNLCQFLVQELIKKDKLNDELIGHLMNCHLQTLILKDCVSFSPDVFTDFEKKSIRNTIEILDLSSSSVNDDSIGRICQNCPNLNVLLANECANLTAKVFYFENNVSPLTCLQLSGTPKKRFTKSTPYNAFTLECISKLFPNVQRLSFRWWETLNVDAMSILGQLSSLEYIDLDYNRSLLDDGIKSMLKNKKCFKGISLVGCIKLTNETIFALSECTGLESLVIASNSKITDKPFELLIKNCTSLKELNLAYIDNLSNEGLSMIGQSSSIEVLELSTQRSITLEGIEKLCQPSLLHSLVRFRIDNMKHILIDDNFLTEFSKHANQLEEIYLDNCSNLSSVGISSLCKANPKLRVIFIGVCPKLGDAGLLSIAENCKDIQEIIVGNVIRGVSDKGIVEISKNCPNLRVLDLLHEGQYNKIFVYRPVTDIAAIALAKGCPNLETLCLRYFDVTDQGLANFNSLVNLNIKGCVKLTSQGIKQVVKNCHQLKNLMLEDCPQLDDINFEEELS